MPSQFPFGKPYPRAIDPVQSGIANGRGLYRWSAFYAPLATTSGPNTGVLEADTELAGKEVAMLLFTSDIPVIAHGFVAGTQIRYNIAGVINLLDLPSAFVSATPGGAEDARIANYGEVLKGYTQATKVSVSGFPVRFYDAIIPPLSTTVTDGLVVPDAVTSIALSCIANGAVASGVVGYSFFGKPTQFSTAAPTPVILFVDDYSQAIKDNDNLLVDADGNLGQVVGLYYRL